jgi:predicted nicotinamide N-methyase
VTRTSSTVLQTSEGDLELHEHHIHLAGRDWSILHAGTIVSDEEEQRLLSIEKRPPYGVFLWASSIALAQDITARGDEMNGLRVLELGAGTGLPGLVAASLGATVVQTERHPVSLDICRQNAERNSADSIEHRLGDWAEWTDDTRYDVILGSDILYAERMHEHLVRIFERNLSEGGRLLLSDPFRKTSWPPLQELEARGWRISVTRWNIGEGDGARAIGTYEVRAPSI